MQRYEEEFPQLPQFVQSVWGLLMGCNEDESQDEVSCY